MEYENIHMALGLPLPKNVSPVEANTNVSLCEPDFLSCWDAHSFCQTVHSGCCHLVSRSYCWEASSSISPALFLSDTTSSLPPDEHAPNSQRTRYSSWLLSTVFNSERQAYMYFPLFFLICHYLFYVKGREVQTSSISWFTTWSVHRSLNWARKKPEAQAHSRTSMWRIVTQYVTYYLPGRSWMGNRVPGTEGRHSYMDMSIPSCDLTAIPHACPRISFSWSHSSFRLKKNIKFFAFKV